MGRKKKQDDGSGGSVFIMPSLYNETLRLLAEAHDYFHFQGHHDQMNLTQRERTMFTSEMSRITIRLSCIMAWLMARKAVFSGKLSEKDAIANFRLDCREVCLNQHIEAETMLPPAMTALLDETFELYQRIARLDDEQAPPVH